VRRKVHRNTMATGGRLPGVSVRGSLGTRIRRTTRGRRRPARKRRARVMDLVERTSAVARCDARVDRERDPRDRGDRWLGRTACSTLLALSVTWRASSWNDDFATDRGRTPSSPTSSRGRLSRRSLPRGRALDCGARAVQAGLVHEAKRVDGPVDARMGHAAHRDPGQEVVVAMGEP